MRAKRVCFFLLVLAGLAWCFLPIPLPFSGDRGEYNTITGLIWCSDEWSCLHEIGHKMDHQGGWISHSDEFRQALKVYQVTEIQAGYPSALARLILDYPFSRSERYGYDMRAELYADIFSQAQGDPDRLPPLLGQFYDKTLARVLIKEYIPDFRLECGGF